jgi:hypothetical protein
MLHTIHKNLHAKTLFAALLLGVASNSWALTKTYSVSATAGKGTHTTIQSAINDCGSGDVCTINVLDVTTTLLAPIWIENKSNITLKSATASGARSTLQFNASLYTLVTNPNYTRGYGSGSGKAQDKVYKLFTLSGEDIYGVADSSTKRPTGWLMWPYVGEADGTQVNGPVGASTDTSNEYSHSGFQYNGLIVVRKSQDVTIKGFKLIGKPYIFQNQNVWSQKYDVLFGTVGVNLMQSLRINVDSNDIGGFFTALYINGRNIGGMFGSANPSDVDVKSIVPLSRYGQVGNHNIQRNYLHDNWWCMYGESIWDLSSRIHHNIAYNNVNKSFQYADSLTVANANTSEMNNQTGGFYYMKDQVLAADRIYNNTILSSPIIIGMGYWRAGVQDLFYNNVVRPSVVSTIKSSDDHQMLQRYGQTVWNNTFQLEPSVAVTWKTTLDNQKIYDAGLTGVYGTTSTCAAPNGCNMGATYRNASQIQPQFNWNNWGISENLADSVAGENLLYNGNAITSISTISGYAGKKYFISSTNAYGPWGYVNKMSVTPRQMDSTTSLPRNNLYAITLPTILDTIKKDTSYTQAAPTNVFQLAPAWDSLTVKNTILHQAWNNDNTGNSDGSSGNRGAFCHDSTTGKTSIGCAPSGVTLSLTDQQIVGISTTKVSIPLIISQVDGSGVSTSHFSGFKVDSVYYYHGFPWGNLDSAYQAKDHYNEPYVLPEKYTSTSWDGNSGSYLTFNINTALTSTESVVRFEVFMSALDPTTGKRVSTIGLYFYRKLDYTLKVQFCSDIACTKIINSARVDDSVYMKVTTLKTADSSAVAQTVSSVYVSPSGGTVINLKNDSVISNQNLFLSSFTSSFTTPVKFQTAGTVGLAVTGLLGSSTSAISVLGVGTIKIRPGLPYTVQFVTPQTHLVQTCNSNPSDTANGCNEFTTGNSTKTTLLVTDKYGNAVDTAATVAVTSSPTVFVNATQTPAGGSTGLGTIASGAATLGVNSLNVTTDSVGNAYLYSEGSVGTAVSYYSTNVYPWMSLQAVVTGTAYPSYPSDSAWVRLLPSAGKLKWISPDSVDTLINTAVPVKVIFTKDGLTPFAVDTTINLYSGNVYIKFYTDSTLKTPLTTTTAADGSTVYQVRLSSGSIRVWVASTRAGTDSLYAKFAEAVATTAIPATFTIPVTPQLNFGVFKDGSCDGVADSVVFQFKAAGSASSVQALDRTKAAIDTVRIYTASGDSVVLDSTAVRYQAGDTTFAVVLTALQAAKFSSYAPTATATAQAVLKGGTLVSLGSAKVTDGISPRPVAASIVENSTPATVADTVRVKFSEPVTYTGTSFPFLVNGKAVTGITVAASKNSAGGPATVADTLLTFVLTGNTSGQVSAGSFLSIDSGKGIADVAGNSGRYSECAGDTALISLQPVAVPVTSAWISDIDGDGAADLITVNFRRKFKTVSEAPDSLVVTGWGTASSTTFLWAKATAVDSATYTFPATFAKGLTVGTNADGSANLILKQGSLRTETYELVDSVPPVAVKFARLTYGSSTGMADTLVVTYSEKLKQTTGTVWIQHKSVSGTVNNLSTTSLSALPTTTDSLNWSYPLPTETVEVGDSVRLDVSGASALAAISGNQLPSTTGNASYVPVVGGDRAPDSAWVIDRDGDGTGDAVMLYYSIAPKGNPSFTFTWGGVTVKVDSAAYGGALAGTKSYVSVHGFPANVTSGTGVGTSTSVVNGAATSPLSFVLHDGIAPVIDSAYVSYGSEEGYADTLRLKLSEPVSQLGTSGSIVDPNLINSITLIKRTSGGVQVIHPFNVTSTTAALGLLDGGTTLKIVCDSCVDVSGTSFGLPGYGDSATLQPGLSDALANAVGTVSKWVPVLTGAVPVRYAAGVYPQSVHVATDTTAAVIKTLPPVTSWILPTGSSATQEWTAVGSTAQGATQTLSSPDAQSGLFGVKVDLNTSFDGQFLVYDNLGVFVGKTELALDIDSLKTAGLVNSKGRYSLVVALNGYNNGTQLASGVYMIRLISYSKQVVNGKSQRVMIQNKLFKIGYQHK